MFFCTSDNVEIPLQMVNDNYCDCKDGSDEYLTHVCNEGAFYCSHEIDNYGNIRRISNMFVNDGICDCCDCSDEVTGLKSDICIDSNTNTLVQIISEYNDMVKGRANAVLGKSKKQVILSIKNQKLLYNRVESEKILSRYKKTNRITKEQHKRYDDLNRFQQVLQELDELLIKKNKHALCDLFGKQLQYLGLVLPCFYSLPFGEQEMKRGSANYYNKYYSIEFCPFRSITQISNRTDTWRQRNDFVKNGGSKANAAKIVDNSDMTWEYTLLGMQNAWIDQISLSDNLKMYLTRGAYRTQIYQGEDICIDGSHRITAVLYECGIENEIVQFREFGMCNYEMIFKTPFACTSEDIESKKKYIATALSQKDIVYDKNNKIVNTYQI